MSYTSYTYSKRFKYKFMTINYNLLVILYRTTCNKHFFHHINKPDNITSLTFVRFDDPTGEILRIVISVLPHYILIDDIDDSTHDCKTV